MHNFIIVWQKQNIVRLWDRTQNMMPFCILHIYLPFNHYINFNLMVVDVRPKHVVLNKNTAALNIFDILYSFEVVHSAHCSVTCFLLFSQPPAHTKYTYICMIVQFSNTPVRFGTLAPYSGNSNQVLKPVKMYRMYTNITNWCFLYFKNQNFYFFFVSIGLVMVHWGRNL